MGCDGPVISVIVPVFQERGVLELARHIRFVDTGSLTEVIVVDGACPSSVAVLGDTEITVLASDRGRAVQQNKGVRYARGDILMFLPADTRLPQHAFDRVADMMSDAALAGGAFALRFDCRHVWLKLIGCITTWRSFINRIPYADQCIFVRASVFRQMGGFSPLPFLEDVDFMRRMKQQGHRIQLTGLAVTTSARRYQRDGYLRCTIKNRIIMLGYQMGVSVKRLARWYSTSSVSCDA